MLMHLFIQIIRMFFSFTFHVMGLLLGCFVRLLYWSVRRYGWGRVFCFFGALTISGWLNFRLLPAIYPEICILDAKIILFGVPLGTLVVWGIGWGSIQGIGYAWRASLAKAERLSLSALRERRSVGTGLKPVQIGAESNSLAPANQPMTIPTESGPLWEQVNRWENLLRAWQRVEANSGGAGPDGITLEAFAMDWENQLRQLHEDIKAWRYRPQLPRVVEVPKKSGGMRRLAIFNVRDRVAQQLLNQVLLPVWDSRFAPCSYAYRPRRSAHQAINAVEKAVQNGRPWIVDADIESFFDSVPHQKLQKQLESWLDDESVFTLLSAMLTSASDDGIGLPQGSALSPLLSNLYLHSFDEAIIQRGYAMHRYADDYVILCPTQQQAEESLTTSQRLLKALELRLNEQKTRIVHINEGFTFLGFTFTEEGKRPSEDAVKSLNERLRNAPDETKRQRIETGWRAYFGKNSPDIDGFNTPSYSTDSTGEPVNQQMEESDNMPYQDFDIWGDDDELDRPPYPPLGKGGEGGFEPQLISEPPHPDKITLLSDEHWNTYCQRFVGRKDLFAKYWQNEDGRCGYVPVRRAIDKPDVEEHLSGREILGTYLLEQDGTTKSLVFDVDGPTLDESGRQKAHQLAMPMLEALDGQGIKPLLLDSGGKGRHLWLCFAEPVQAKPVRQWAQSFLDNFRPFPDGVLVEVFPKQDLISGNALGAMLRLPLGKHPQTSRFGSLLDENGQEVTNPWHVLRTHPLIKPSMLDTATNSAVTSEIPKPPEAVEPIIKGCSLLRALVEKASSKRNLKHTERLALLYTLGHCGDAGSAYIHQLIALCSNYNPRITERFIGRLEPGHKAIRCSTLKEWLKDYLPGVDCECQQKKKNPAPIDLLSLSKKTARQTGKSDRSTTASQAQKSGPTVSEQDWDALAEDLFDFTNDE